MSTEFVSGNVYIRKNVLKEVGDRINGHTHNFDHTTIFFRGAFHVKATLPNGEIIERDFVAPAHALIKAEVKHEIIATSKDSEFWCVYSHRTPQGDIAIEATGWGSAYV